MQIDKEELSDRTVWHKYLKYDERKTDDDSVWYRRFLRSEEPEGALLDGEYLLRFFESRARHDAIEFAVIASRPGVELISAMDHLDNLARAGLYKAEQEHITGSFADMAALSKS